MSLSVLIGPVFFKKRGYTVDYTNNTSLGTISNFEATNLFSNSIIASIIGYMFYESSKERGR
jgi:hypothetical protein